MSNFNREVTATIIDGKLFHVSTENKSTISYLDFNLIWKRWKNGKFENITIIHTHPDGFYMKSNIDTNTIKGWALALGVPIIFIILTRLSNKYDEISLLAKKYIVKLDKNNAPVIYDDSYLVDVNNDKLCILLDKCSRKTLFKNYYYKLIQNLNSKIDLDKELL